MFFDILNTKDGMQIGVKPETLTIKVFRDIFNADKSKDKSKAYKDFSYIYHMCDYNSPYSNTVESDRSDRIIDEVIAEKYTPDKLTLEGCKVYKELMETPTSKMLTVIKKKVNESIEFLDNLDINEDNIKMMQTLTKDFTSFMSSYKQLEDLVNKEKAGVNERIKGDKKVNSKYAE